MEKIKSPSRYMDMGYFLAGVCFLCLPTVAIFDLLPTCIGYALLFRALYRLSDLNDAIASARRLFGRAVILGLIRYLSIPFVFGFISANERPVMILTVTFTLAVLNLATLIPAWKHLGSGMIYLATRHEGTAVFARKGKTSRNLTEKMISFTVLYLLVRETMATLPELTVLVSQWGGADADSGSFMPQLYGFVGLLRLFALVISLVVGVVWISRMVCHIRRLSGDKPFWDNLRHGYETTVLTRPALFAKRAVKASLIVLCVAFAFSVDLFLDEINVLPDTVIALLLLVGLWMLRRYVHRGSWMAAVASAAVYALVSAAEWVLQMDYFRLGDAVLVYRDAELYQAYTVICGARILSRVMFLVTLVLVLRVMKDIVIKHTGFSVTKRDSADPDGHVRAVHDALIGRLWWVLVAGILAAVSSVLYVTTLPMAGNSLWEAWVLADAVIQGVFSVVFGTAVNAIFEQMEYKYMLT